MTELLVGTKKGLFVLQGDPAAGEPFEIARRAFPGDIVEYAMRDPRTGRYFASHTSGFYGPRLMYTDDPTGEWTQATGPAFPEDGDDGPALERIWVITPGEADNLLYAGVAPAALFTTTHGGESWSRNEPRWKERHAGRGRKSGVADHPGRVTMRTLVGSHRVVDMLVGEQLPRIC